MICTNNTYRLLYQVLLLVILFIAPIALSSQCSGSYYDTGGSGANYSNNEDYTFTYTAPAGKILELTVVSYSIENSYDFLYFYDGASTAGTYLGRLTGTGSNITITSQSGSFTMRFDSDNTITAPGWEIQLSCSDAPEYCYAIAESNNGGFYRWEGNNNNLVGTMNLAAVEAMALNYDGTVALVADAGNLHSIDLSTGSPTLIGAVGTGSGLLGNITLDDIDGLAINPTNGLLLGVHRRGSSNDVLIAINPITGEVEKNYFGVGEDYREITGALTDIDDIAFHPTTYELYGISTVSSSTTNDVVVFIDQYTGAATPISTLPSCDIEGLSFDENGNLYGSSGFEECTPYEDNTIYLIDFSTANGSLTKMSTIPQNDVEALACYVPSVAPCVTVTTAGTIEASQNICDGLNPNTITSASPANNSTGGTIEYQWYMSTTSCVAPLNQDPAWTEIAGATGLDYNPGNLTESTCFIRGARTAGCNVFTKFTNVVSIDIIDCECTSSITNIQAEVQSGVNDAEEDLVDGSFGTTSSDLEMVEESNTQAVGIRFSSLALPSNAEVVNATLIFTADETRSRQTDLIIKAEANTSSQDFSANPIITGRATTSDSVEWNNIQPWDAGTIYNSVNVARVVQSVVDLPSWTSGDPLTFLITGSGKRVAESFDKAGDGHTKISIDYCLSEICANGIDDDNDGLIDCEDFDCGEILNRQFNRGLTGFELLNLNGNSSSVSIDNNNVLVGENSARIDFTSSNGTNTNTQFIYDGVSISQDKIHEIYFTAKASSSKSIDLRIVQTSNPANVLYSQSDINISTTATSYYYEFLSSQEYIDDVSYILDVGGDTDTIWIDNMQLKESCITCPTLSVAGSTTMCIGDTIRASATTANGTWTSVNPSIATIDSEGLITAVNSGSVRFVYNSNGGVCVDTSNFEVDVIGTPVISNTSQDSICLNDNTVALSTSIAGLWTSTDESVLIVDNNGNITPVAPGDASVYVEANGAGCRSENYDLNIKIAPVLNSAGDDTLCVGETQTLSANISGTWSVSDGSVVSISAGGTITALSAGFSTILYNADNGCSEVYQDTIIVNALPSLSLNPDITVCDGENVSFTGTATGNGPFSFQWDNGLGTSLFQSFTADGDSTMNITNSYNCVVTDRNGCTGSDDININILSTPTVIITHTDQSCGQPNGSITFTYLNHPNRTNIELSIDGGINFTNRPLNSNNFAFNNLTPGSYPISVRWGDDSCPIALDTVVIDPEVPPSVSAPSFDICIGNTMPLTSDASGLWTSSDENIATVTNAGVLVAIAPGKVALSFTANGNGCTSVLSDSVEVYPSLTANLDYLGNICLTDTSQLTISNLNGTGSYTYSWTGPNGFTSNLDTIAVVEGGNYYVTITDNSSGCQTNTSGFIYAEFEPFIITLNSEVCEGESVTLEIGGAGSTTYQWDSNAANSTSNSVTVIPSVPSSTYNVTVTNSQGCPGYADATILVNEKPTVDLSSVFELCAGDTIDVAPSTPGIWDIANNSIIAIEGTSLIGLFDGSTTFTFTDTVTDCTSDQVGPITVHPIPVISLNGIDSLCVGESGQLSPNDTGLWISTDLSILSVTNSGLVTANSEGSARFIFQNTITNCVSDTSLVVESRAMKPITLNGPNDLCEEAMLSYSASTGPGIFLSSNTSVFTVNGSEITGVNAGNATLSYSYIGDACFNDTSLPITILDKTQISNTGADTLCVDETTILSPTSGGVWQSQDVSTASITNGGVVTALQSGVVNFTFTTANGCTDTLDLDITIDPNPSLALSSDITVCDGEEVSFGGTSSGVGILSYQWDNGLGTNLSQSFTATGNPSNNQSTTYTCVVTDENGCTADDQITINVLSNPSPTLTHLDETCGLDNGSITFSFNDHPDRSVIRLSITDGASYSNSSDNSGSFTFFDLSPGIYYTGSIWGNGQCYVSLDTITILPEEPPVISSPTLNICDGNTASLSNDQSGTWTSSDDNIATVTSTGILIGVNPGKAYLTFTADGTGCQSFLADSVTVYPELTAGIDFMGQVCLTDTSQLSVLNLNGSGSYNYSWVGPNGFSSSLDTINITESGNYSVTISDAISGCETSTNGFVFSRFEPFIVSLNTDICEGESVDLEVNGAPSSTYQWDSNAGNSTSNQVTVIPSYPSSTYNVTVTNSQGCPGYADATVDVKKTPTIDLFGIDELCVGDTIDIVPSATGEWTIGNTNVISIVNNGLIGLIDGNSTIAITDTSNDCTSQVVGPITVHPIPVVDLQGLDSLCVGESAQLAPLDAGSWTATNTSVYTINNNGIITAVGPGASQFIFQNAITTCISDTSMIVEARAIKDITLTGPSSLCEEDIITYTASAGPGIWTSTNNSIFSTNNDEVYALLEGTATLNYTYTGNACFYDNSMAIEVRTKPNVFLTGPDLLCIGEVSTLTPTTGGIWSTNDPGVATVTSTGGITAIGGGEGNFTFTATNGCQDTLTNDIIVVSTPQVILQGPNQLCIGEYSTALPNTGGIWTSTNNSIVGVTSSGLISGLSAGSATLSFTEGLNGCPSDTTIDITVFNTPLINFSGPTSICIGDTTIINHNSANNGIWISTNPFVAQIDDNGEIVGLNPGITRFRFQDTTSGCASSFSGLFTVNNRPLVNLNGLTNLCEGDVAYVEPSSGGTWTSSDPSVATITNSGQITGISNGIVTLEFSNSATGCPSLPSSPISIDAIPTVDLIGSDSICFGNTGVLTASRAGIWTSNNPSIATVTSVGVISTVNPGIATFNFVTGDGVCTLNMIQQAEVLALPMTSISGDDKLCIGDTTLLVSNTTGSWSSSNISIATIDSIGKVEAVQGGDVTFSIVADDTGCISDPSNIVTVYNDPIINLNGDNTLCIGESTNVTPSTGGFWSSSNPTSISVNTGGSIIGLTPGASLLTFTESATGCSASLSDSLRVSPFPVINITGPLSVCQGETSSITSDQAGTWSSLNPAIASIDNSGIITGVSQGLTRFQFTSVDGCVSQPSPPFVVYEKPVIVNPNGSFLCIGETASLFPSAGGVWESGDTTVATISSSGILTGIGQGTVALVFTDNATGCVSDTFRGITILPQINPSFNGPTGICVGESTSILPSTGGLWFSTNPNLASIDNQGNIIGLGSGTVKFYQLDLSTGCVSDTSDLLTISEKPLPQFLDTTSICVGDTIFIEPANGGVWTSTNTSIASVNNSGMIIAQSPGVVRFTYAEGSCISDLSDPLTVNNSAVPPISDFDVCHGDSLNLISGSWEVLDTTFGTIINSYFIPKTDGTVGLNYTETTSGCSSAGPVYITIDPQPIISFTDGRDVCMGYRTQIAANTTGTWSINDNDVANISNSGLISAKSPGRANVLFTSLSTGCVNDLSDGEINVTKCTNPDVNVGLIEMELSGSMATNDIAGSLMVYSAAYQTKSIPLNANIQFNINSDGSYTFQSDIEGVYEFQVEVCHSDSDYGCNYQDIKFQLYENIYGENNVVTIPNIVSVKANALSQSNSYSLVFDPTVNDACLNSLGCVLDGSSLSSNYSSSKATLVWSGSTMSYEPNDDVLATDTVIYSICDSTSICIENKVYTTMLKENADNTIDVSDAFAYLYRGDEVTIDLLKYIIDAEGDNFSITPQGTISNPVVWTGGEYYISSGGELSFKVDSTFSGHAEVIYEACDDNGACQSATVHFLILEDLSLTIRVYLQGAFINSDGSYSSEGHQLMSDLLRDNPFTGTNLIPLTDPYESLLGGLDLSVIYPQVGPGQSAELKTITDPSIFSIIGENAIVDWVHIQLRDKADSTHILATRSALLQRDGDVIDLDGSEVVRFPGVGIDSFYVVVKHRSHLGAMSEIISNSTLADFTDPLFPVFDFGYVSTVNQDFTGLAMTNIKGEKVLWAGDFDGNGKIKFTSPRDDTNILFGEVLFHPNNLFLKANYDFGFAYALGDFDMNGKVKFTNPSDDTNFLFGQLLFYPLNISLLDNFDFFIEQVPK